MNIDGILSTLNHHHVRYILIGGVNFLLNHKPVLTFDLDIWIDDSLENHSHLLQALIEMEAEWGPREESWKKVSFPTDWLKTQSIFCLLTKFGALDLFREVRGLEGGFEKCYAEATPDTKTIQGTPYVSLSDLSMIQCQLALPLGEQKQDRILDLQKAILMKELNKS